MRYLIFLLFILPATCSVSAQADSMRFQNEEKINEYKKNLKAKTILFQKNVSSQIDIEQAQTDELRSKEKEVIEVQDGQVNFGAKQFKAALKASQAEALNLGIGELELVNFGQNKNRLSGPSQFDSRIELSQLDPLIEWQYRVLNNAGSVGLIVKKENLEQVSDSAWKLGTGITLGKKYNLCQGQAFAGQPVAGEGTGFLVSKDEVLTAAHVLTESADQYALVFGFEIINKAGSYTSYIPSSNIYYLKQVVVKDDNLDVAIIGIDRETNRLPLNISDTIPVNADQVYMIGFPSGLPQKISLNAEINGNDDPVYFYTSLDAFQGNSGSPVFSLKSHKVIGILVSGETDYAWNGHCNVTTLCRIPFCKGEKAVRIAQVMKIKAGAY